jgi:hypothetical protein
MSVDEIAAAIEGLSFSEKLDLMERLSSLFKRGGNTRNKNFTPLILII